jgi:hypothetical protein
MVTVAKHRPTKPHIKVQAAAEHLASVPGATLQSAAKHCGLSVPRLRELLAYPHNLAYVKKVRDLAIEALTTSGPATLAKVIAEDSNKMATVAAVKTAHLLQRSAAEESGRLSASKPAAGLIIVIGNQSGGGTVLEPRLAGARSVERIAYEPVSPAEEPAEVLPVRVR